LEGRVRAGAESDRGGPATAGSQAVLDAEAERRAAGATRREVLFADDLLRRGELAITLR
jgi:hypothetical protein